MDYPSDIGSALVRERRARNVTQRELGERVGVTQPQVARWEAREYASASLDRVDAVARALEVGTPLNGVQPVAAETRTPYPVLTDPLSRLGVTREAIAEYCRRHRIAEFGFFGSVLREDYRASSDVDVLVRFADDAEGGFGPLVDAEADLGALLGREVDLVERSALERSGNYIRRRSILGDLHNVYAA